MKETKSEWPKVVKDRNATVKVYKYPNQFRIVFYDTDGSRKTLSEQDEAKAMKVAAKTASRLSTFGGRVACVQPELVAEYVRLDDLLKPHGVTVDALVTAGLGWLTTHKTIDGINRALTVGAAQVTDCISRTVTVAVEEFLAHKENNKAAKASKSYLLDLKYRLRVFSGDFNCEVCAVNTVQLQEWLDKKNLNATSYNNFRRVLHVFFEYCRNREFCHTNPVANDKTAVETRESTSGDTPIYTPAEMKRLLDASSPDFLPMLVICGFGGVRSEEFLRMTWEHVDFKNDGGHIVLGKDVVKGGTASRRVVPMSANLKAWLMPYKDKTGPIWTGLNGKRKANNKQVYIAQKRCATNANVTWKKNALRHSFCSYRLAETKDAVKVSFEAGNSPKIVHRHYKALTVKDGDRELVVTEALAKEWFNILPTK